LIIKNQKVNVGDKVDEFGSLKTDSLLPEIVDKKKANP